VVLWSARDVCEVSDVFCEDGPTAGDCSTEYLGVGGAAEPQISQCHGIDPDGPESFGQCRRIDLVDDELHRASAAAVPLR